MTLATEAIDRNWEGLLSGLEGQQRTSAADVLRRLRENLVRLTWRYEECKLVGVAVALAEKPNQPTDYDGPTLEELQLRLVDKVEAFHQHIYATLAVLALVVNQRRDKASTQPYPVGQITKFLAALRERDFRYRDRYLDHLALLERSADFRSKYVDHPERHRLHDWMTYRYFERQHIIYFIKRSNAVFWRGTPADPSSLDFRPPVDCGEDFYVSPDTDQVHDAMQRIVVGVLSPES